MASLEAVIIGAVVGACLALITIGFILATDEYDD